MVPGLTRGVHASGFLDKTEEMADSEKDKIEGSLPRQCQREAAPRQRRRRRCRRGGSSNRGRRCGVARRSEAKGKFTKWEAVALEGRSHAQPAPYYHVSKGRASKLVAIAVEVDADPNTASPRMRPVRIRFVTAAPLASQSRPGLHDDPP